MKNIALFLFVMCAGLACRKTEVVSEPSQIIISNSWKLDRFTDVDGKTLSQNQLNSQAQALFGLDFEFRGDNVTRARDRISKQILNGGTWYLADANQNLDIDINGFKGKFKVIQLVKGKMILQAENNKMISAGEFVKMEFIPAL